MNADLDVRLVDPFGVSSALAKEVREQHTRPARTTACPCCGWVATRRERQCRSYVVADALIRHRGVPVWHGDDDQAVSVASAGQDGLFPESPRRRGVA
jgi:hypothetical protein